MQFFVALEVDNPEEAIPFVGKSIPTVGGFACLWFTKNSIRLAHAYSNSKRKKQKVKIKK